MAVAKAWVLMVMVLGSNGAPAMSPVPGYYLSESSCETVASSVREKLKDGRPTAACLPVDANP